MTHTPQARSDAQPFLFPFTDEVEELFEPLEIEYAVGFHSGSGAPESG